MQSPFSPDYADCADEHLIDEALLGSKNALRELIARHQPFVYNLALKMFGARADAEDVAQEVLVKAITSLRSFQRKSAFRTWLYRITVNHFLSTRRRGLELQVSDFEHYFDAIAAVSDEEEEEEAQPLVVEELRIRCTSGMLMCLSRAQRIVFILGEVFGADHQMGSQMMECTPANFRAQLSRARRDLREWMNERCGLVNPKNTCRCYKKARAYVDAGVVDPDRLVFNTDYVVKIGALTRARSAEVMATIDALRVGVFATHPFQVMEDTLIREFFDL